MRNTIKSTVFKTCGLGFFLLLFSLNAWSYIIANESEAAYNFCHRESIGATVPEAAGFFLESHSAFLSCLNKIERSGLNGLDYNELQQLIGKTIGHMEDARAKYIDLVQMADSAYYDQEVFTVLLNFDYSVFQANRGLNGFIFSQVEDYLGSGNIRGIYGKLLSDTMRILDQLAVIKSAVDSGTFPVLSDLWRVNQIYSETLLFGQYTAEVFFDITGK